MDKRKRRYEIYEAMGVDPAKYGEIHSVYADPDYASRTGLFGSIIYGNNTTGELFKFFIPHKTFYSPKHAGLRKGTYEHYQASKKARKGTLIGFLIFLAVLFLISTIIYIVNPTIFYKNDPDTCAKILSAYPGTLGFNPFAWLIDIIVEAFLWVYLRILWMIFIYPVANIAIGMETIFMGMGLANLLPTLVKDKSVAVVFTIFAGVGVFAFICFFAVRMMSVSMGKNKQQGEQDLRNIPKNLFMGVLTLVLALAVFLVANTLLNYFIVEILNLLPTKHQSLPLFVYNCSFTDHIHNETSIASIPSWDFSITVGIVGQAMCLLILGWLNVSMLMSLLELVVRYVAVGTTLGKLGKGDTMGFNFYLSQCKNKFIYCIGIYFAYFFAQLFIGIMTNIGIAQHGTTMWTFQAFLCILLIGIYLLIKQLPTFMTTLFDAKGQGMNAQDYGAVGRKATDATGKAGKATGKVVNSPTSVKKTISVGKK